MKCERYIIQELVPPEIYRDRGERAWELLDTRLLITLDAMSQYFGPIIVNNWHNGGSYKESGLRSWGTSTGARLSQHLFGRGGDCKPQRVTVQEMYEQIIAMPERFPHLTTLEDIAFTPSWLHVDCRNNHQAGIRIVKP